MSPHLEEILELARKSKSPKIADTNLKAQVKFPNGAVPKGVDLSPESELGSAADGGGPPVTDPSSTQQAEAPGCDHTEWQDNEDMTAMGLTINPSGGVHHGAMKVGHVVTVPNLKNRYVGIHHPSGAMTDAHPNRARAAMALMHFHHFMPRKGKSDVQLSNSRVEEVLELAQKMGKVNKKNLRTPKEGVKQYGAVTFADPKNKKYPIDTEEHVRAALGYINKPHNASVYPLNGVSLASVKGAIETAAKKFGIQVSDDSGK